MLIPLLVGSGCLLYFYLYNLVVILVFNPTVIIYTIIILIYNQPVVFYSAITIDMESDFQGVRKIRRN